MISLNSAKALLDFDARLGDGSRAQEQLEGAVAIHNILQKHKIAYLADDVGMGKTYVALGALALLRHYHPNFRVLVIAPRENIQHKWMKELRNFVAHNVRHPALHIKGPDGKPVRPLVACANLLELVRETQKDPDRDFFVRLSSFSLPLRADDPNAAQGLREALRRAVPGLPDNVFDLRNKNDFKKNVARAICCALPRFDLVIIDEAHNLKGGVSDTVAARNLVLALVLGHARISTDRRSFRKYGARAERVLFLSATPLESSYKDLWNQLDVFDRGEGHEKLSDDEASEDEQKKEAQKFLIRRLTTVTVAGEQLIKNQYRREWRQGGVSKLDEPLRIKDPRQRLIVALVQKKVSELLGHERFNRSFQIGMLASFESFLETARLKKGDNEISNFDDARQSSLLPDREGIDVVDVNKLSDSYRSTFGKEMPHPKMDALVDALSGAWKTGRKALVFVRRVASVKELKRKLDDKYDDWLMTRLLRELPQDVHPRLRLLFEQYSRAHLQARQAREATPQTEATPVGGGDDDRGGTDTFFAWFFRGDGPGMVISGANVQQRFIKRGTAYSTFFEDNYVADLLGCKPGEVTQHLATALSLDEASLRSELRDRSCRFLTPAQRPARADRFEAVQAAAVEWLKEMSGPWQDLAKIVWKSRFSASLVKNPASEAPEIGNQLEVHTFFSRLRDHEELRTSLWPRPGNADTSLAFRERELRRVLLASAARLGHAFIDLYVLTIQRLKNLELRALDGDDTAFGAIGPIDGYLDLLERQMEKPLGQREWAAFDELAEIAANFDLLLDVNAPDAQDGALAETARNFGQLLRQQQPVGGMSGQLNQTLVRQFRMPGYPLVLITTDLLQEGEDLHTFCSDVYHYGIAWTSSSMEQRIGRIDRVRSQTERRLKKLSSSCLQGVDKLQVYFPHLKDSVEALQVDCVLERMDEFLRLTHEILVARMDDERSIDTAKEFARGRPRVEPIRGKLKTVFPIGPEHFPRDHLPES